MMLSMHCYWNNLKARQSLKICSLIPQSWFLYTLNLSLYWLIFMIRIDPMAKLLLFPTASISDTTKNWHCRALYQGNLIELLIFQTIHTMLSVLILKLPKPLKVTLLLEAVSNFSAGFYTTLVAEMIGIPSFND